MLEHDDAGNAVTFPPPLVVVPPLSSSPPPPQPAAANASAAKRQSATALKLVFTLPPPSPICAIVGVRSGQYPACAGQIANGHRRQARRPVRTSAAACET